MTRLTVQKMESTEPAIEVDGVSKQYIQLKDTAMLLRSVMPFNRPKRDKLMALTDMNFSIDPGETLGLVGESGCGKSTTGRAVLQLVPATSGSVRFDGQGRLLDEDDVKHDDRKRWN